MDIKNIFDSCVSLDPFNLESYSLLEKIMSITSPMKFDDSFASNEELDRLEAELDRFNLKSSEAEILRKIIWELEPKQTNNFVFI